MESSVDFGGAFDLWKALLQKMGIATRTPRKCEFSGVFFHPFRALLCGFLCRCLLQIVLVKVKTAKYQA